MVKPFMITGVALFLVLSGGSLIYRSHAFGSVIPGTTERVELEKSTFGQPLPGSIKISGVPKGGIFCPKISDQGL